MISFLAADLSNVISSIMDAFLKRDMRANANIVSKLRSVDVIDKPNLIHASKVDVGFSAHIMLMKLMSSKMVSEKRVGVQDGLQKKLTDTCREITRKISTTFYTCAQHRLPRSKEDGKQ